MHKVIKVFPSVKNCSENKPGRGRELMSHSQPAQERLHTISTSAEEAPSSQPEMDYADRKPVLSDEDLFGRVCRKNIRGANDVDPGSFWFLLKLFVCL